MRIRFALLTMFLFLVCAMNALAAPQDAAPSLRTLDDVAAAMHAAHARIRAAVSLYHDPVGPRTWIDGSRLWYCLSTREGDRAWWIADSTKTGSDALSPLFDHDAAAAHLTMVLGRDVSALKLPVRAVEAFASHVRVTFEGVEVPVEFDFGGDVLASAHALVTASESASSAATSAEWEVVCRDGCLRVLAGGAEIFVTADCSSEDGYFGEFSIAPTHDAFIAFKTTRARPHPIHIIESAPKDQLQPRLKTFEYAKPGDAIDRAFPHIFRVERDATAATKFRVREIPVDTALFANPWSIDDVHFLANGREVAFKYNQRGHQVLRMIALDLETGASRVIAEESFPTFVDYTNKIWHHWLDDSGELLWMSERDGWNHLYVIDVATGTVKRQLTKGEWLVRRVHGVETAHRTMDVALMGHGDSASPYDVHHARIAIDTGEVTMLTSGDGTCRVEFSPDHSALVCVRARSDMPPVYELRRSSDGAVIVELGAGDARAMITAGWRAPERFVAKGRDGTTDIWGLVFRPMNFDPTKKYPVIENIYAGPHDHHVATWFERSSRSREYAELGAIVVQIDGMGTNWRSKAFHDVCWKNLKDAGFPDRIAWIRALAARDSSIDLSRVGIFGGSAGGQNAMRAVLDHADFYRVAVADCGCHDNRMDKIWWNEQWMGWPVDESYARNSNAEDAHKLGGALMLLVGGLDQNVDPASTMQVAQKLIDAKKDFELLVIPNAGHGCAESEYGNLRRAKFLFEHLDALPR